MAIEIERKFAVERTPQGLDAYPCEPIAQGYLAVEEGRREVRVRRRGGRLLLTVKSEAGEVRGEEEVELSEEQFERLWPLTSGRRVSKRRYRIPHGPLTVEVDLYEGELEGLVVAEVEFESEEQGRAFEPPPWFGRELTGEPGYANRRLALDGLPQEERP
jgi:adenylate cyclase